MKLSWIIAGVSAALLYYIYNNPPSNVVYSTGSDDDVDNAATNIGNWGTKQRVSGAGSQIGGKVKEGVGKVTGDEQTEGEGKLDQVVGKVKDAAGQAAQKVEDTVKKANS